MKQSFAISFALSALSASAQSIDPPSAPTAASTAAPGIVVATAEPAQLGEVIVRGEKIGSLTVPGVDEARERIEQTPGGVALVPAEAFENRYALTIKDMLRDTPGVFAQARFGEEVRLSIRGSGLGRSNHLRGITLLQDGVPITAADGFSDFQDIDPLNTRYVEVYKGSNGLRYGGATLGGAINFVAPTGRTAAQEYELRLDGGSYDTYREHASVAKTFGAFDLYGGFTANQAQGFRDHSATDNQRFTGNAGYQFSSSIATRFYLSFNEIDQELPGTVSLDSALNHPRAVLPTADSFNTRRDPTVLRVVNKTSLKIFDGQLDVGGYYSNRRLFHPVTGVVVDQKGSFYGAFAQWNGEGALLGLRNEATLGVNLRYGHNDARLFQNVGGARGAQIGDAIERADTYEIYGEDRLWIAKDLTLIAGLQGIVTDRDYTDKRNAAESADRTYKAVNPKLGLLWQAAEALQVFANLSKSYEAPDYGALNQSAALGANGFVPLAAQRAWTAEIGTRGSHGVLAWDVSYYYAQLDKELLLMATSPTASIQFNADKTVHQGLEAGLAIRLLKDAISAGDKLTFQQNYAWSVFRFDHDATYGRNRLAGAPEHLYQVQLRYEHPLGFFVEPGLEAANHNSADYANTQTAPGYTIWNVSTGLTLPHGLSLFFDARNLLDKPYVSSLSTTTDYSTASNRNLFYPGEGRLFYGGLRLSY